ncbi:hypothetical protein KEM52_002946 [Ascosphaera acerosa]|nr:hypothetical protein KEM52_002946 [Ascosphaera acerosa]
MVGHRLRASRSVLSLALDDECVFAGLQGGEIRAWRLDTYELVLSVQAHEESVLGLYLSDDKRLLFSSGGDSTVNVWSSTGFTRLYSLRSHHDVGDILAVVYSTDLQTIYCGGQNTSLQWCNLGLEARAQRSEDHSHKAVHRFFDSRGPGGLPSVEEAASDSNTESDSGTSRHGGKLLFFDETHHLLYAHNSYIYCMLLVRGFAEAGGADPNDELLLTGSGDGTVKLWRLRDDAAGERRVAAPAEVACFDNGCDTVLSLAVDGPFMFCGLSNGTVNVWNLESRQNIRRLSKHAHGLWALNAVKGIILSGDAAGVVKTVNSRFEETSSWVAHKGIMLSSAIGKFRGRDVYATGGNDNTVAIWDLSSLHTEEVTSRGISNDEMVNALAKLVAFKTISSRPSLAGECNKGAAFLRRHCAYLGAETKLLVTGSDTNPIVYARFNATKTPPRSSSASVPATKTVLFYGHYDVFVAEADKKRRWKTDPFVLASFDGFLYGRGVSDNKGPVLAALYAAADLAEAQALACNVVFVIEGEEEAGSQGFAETVEQHRDLIGNVDYILLANSYWLDDKVPCLTYGLRGVVHANLIVSSPHPDLHSGIDGSALLDEPLKDLTMLISTLVGPKGQINLPGFYDPVLPLTDAEKRRYDEIATTLLKHHPDLLSSKGGRGIGAFTNSLMHRWRQPSLTIHSIDTPSPMHASGTTIARKAQAALSIRIVPNQDPPSVSAQLIDYAQAKFAELGSQNDLTVEITGTAEAWLGDPDDEIFCVLERAVTGVWAEDVGVEKRYPSYAQRHGQPRSLASAAGLAASQGGLRPELVRSESVESLRSQAESVESLRSQASSVSSPAPAKRVIASSSFRNGAASKTADVPTSSTLAHRPRALGPSVPRTRARMLDVVSESSTASRSTTPDTASDRDDRQGRSGADEASLAMAGQQHQQGNQAQPQPQPQASEPLAAQSKPLYIREGGSIPTIRLLEKMFDAPAAHLPCGQASDHAHLDNERMRVENLYKSREIFRRVFGPDGLAAGKQGSREVRM